MRRTYERSQGSEGFGSWGLKAADSEAEATEVQDAERPMLSVGFRAMKRQDANAPNPKLKSPRAVLPICAKLQNVSDPTLTRRSCGQGRSATA